MASHIILVMSVGITDFFFEIGLVYTQARSVLRRRILILHVALIALDHFNSVNKGFTA